MPLYAIICSHCSTQDSIWRPVDKRDELPSCTICGTIVSRVISAPAVQAGFQEYISPGTGKIVTDRRKQADDLARSGCILNEPGLRKDVARYKIEQEDKDFKSVEAGVDKVVSQLVSQGRIES